jgi:hypothetical protein
MADVSQQIKLKILAALDSSPDVTAIVPVSRIFPMRVSDKPEYPFIRYGAPTVEPFEDSCGRGSELVVSLHSFHLSESEAQITAAAIERAISAMEDVVESMWQRTQYTGDPNESSVTQTIVTFQVTDRE